MISIIAAIGNNYELGLNNKLIWNLPSDLKFFKEQTLNSTVVMGKKTYISLPNPLPNRKNIVLSRGSDFKNSDKCYIYNSEEELIKYVTTSNDNIYIIGGEAIYSMFIEIADEIILTEIDSTSPADVYFPKFDKSKFDKIVLSDNNENGISYTYVKYTRK